MLSHSYSDLILFLATMESFRQQDTLEGIGTSLEQSFESSHGKFDNTFRLPLPIGAFRKRKAPDNCIGLFLVDVFRIKTARLLQ